LDIKILKYQDIGISSQAPSLRFLSYDGQERITPADAGVRLKMLNRVQHDKFMDKTNTKECSSNDLLGFQCTRKCINTDFHGRTP
jgi:hypothetical protein